MNVLKEFLVGALICGAILAVSILLYKFVFEIVMGSNLPEWAKFMILHG